MERPRHVVVLVPDSLRWDSVHGQDGARLPYVTGHGIDFREARAPGCWTLPATASLFTGLYPHEHGADTQSRGLRADVPTLAEKMRVAGYGTYQVTANVATTHIFGLHRGFDEIREIWKIVPPRHRRLHKLAVMFGKPRLRRRIVSTDWIAAGCRRTSRPPRSGSRTRSRRCSTRRARSWRRRSGAGAAPSCS